MNKRPIGNCVMLEEVEIDSGKIVGGIVIPDVCEGDTPVYNVIMHGTGEFDENGDLIPFKVDIGERVLIVKDNLTTAFKFDGKDTVITNQNNIIAKVEQ